MSHMSEPSATRVRMAPEQRRAQLVDLGVRLLGTRSLEELSIEVLAEEAGISRGLLYHYFGGKQEFHLAVVRRAAEHLYEVTAPERDGPPLEQLSRSLERYVDYVTANFHGYVSLVRGAAGGHEELRAIYEQARASLTGRLFDAAPEEAAALGLVDTPRVRLVVRGWSAFVEEVVVEWVRDPRGVTRTELLETLGASLPGLLAPLTPLATPG